MSFDRERILAQLDQVFREKIPYSAALGITIVDCGPGMAAFRLPYNAALVGDPATGILHGGAISALMDSCCGASVHLKQEAPINIATLDLRLDYLKPATPGRDVVGRAECYKLTRSIAFVRGFAFHDEGDPIAAVSATFMLATKGAPVVPGSGGEQP